MLQETENLDQNALEMISSRKVVSSQERRHASGVAQKQSLKTQVSFLVLPQQPVDVCRGGGRSTTTEMVPAEEEYQSSNKEKNAQTSADKASDHHSPDAVQPPQHAPPSEPKGQNASLCNPEEHYREATERPGAEQDERCDVDGKSKAPQYGSSHVAQQVSTRKRLQFSDIASVSDMPIQCFTNKGMACVQLCAEIEPYVDRHEQ